MGQLPELLTHVDSMKRIDLEEASDDELMSAIKALVDKSGGMIYTYPPGKENVWWRGRIILADDGDSFDNLHELIARDPEGITSYGRANTPQKSSFYASWNIATVLRELGATSGDSVQLISCRIRPQCKLVVHPIGEIQRNFQSGRSFFPTGMRHIFEGLDPESLDCVMLRDAFLAEEFAKIIKPHQPHKYRLTATLSTYVANRESDNPEIEGERFYPGSILYPSIHARHAMNVAIPKSTADACLEILESTVCKIKHDAGYGIYDARMVKNSHQFGTDGDIDWNAKSGEPKKRPGEFGGLVYDPNYRGWVKNN